MRERLRQARQNESGFTLIELLIVIVILGILAGIVVFAVSGINNRGEVAAQQTTCKTIQTANEAHFAQKGTYATTTLALSTAGFLASEPAAAYTITVAGTPPKATTAGPGC